MNTSKLKLSIRKCALFQKQVKYLGRLVTADGISTDEAKMRAVKDWPRPQNLQELRGFLGLCIYCRSFVPNFAGVAASLHVLTKKSKPYQWGESQEKGYCVLHQFWRIQYQEKNSVILDSDVSGICGVLS